MYIKRFYHESLGHASYLVGCTKNKKAIVIDPMRNVAPYLKVCKEMGFKLEAVAETHLHADYVSGAMELWAEEGCTWYFSREEDDFIPHEKQVVLKHHDSFFIGEVCFDILHTPGHTPEHICFLVTNAIQSDVPVGLFSGDFVFVGDVGRPDLLEKVVGIIGSASLSARQMFQSIQSLAHYPDYLQIWPSHGAGSLCGKALGSLPSSTLGYERRTNWAFCEKDEESFIERLLDAQPEAPPYFARMKHVNQYGSCLIKDLDIPISFISATQLNTKLLEDNTIVDTRPHTEFAKQFLSNTLNIPFGKSFIHWAGWLIDDQKPLYVIAENRTSAAIKNDLLSIGLDSLAGFFEVDEVFSEEREYQTYPSMGAEEIMSSITLLDVRQEHEWEAGHISGALHIPLGKLTKSFECIPKETPVAVYCQAGLRSAIAMSILKLAGFSNVVNVEGGYEAWITTQKYLSV